MLSGCEMTPRGRKRAFVLIGTLFVLFAGCGKSDRGASEDGDEDSGAGGSSTGARGGTNRGGSGNDGGEETGGRPSGGSGNDAGEGGSPSGGSGNDAGEGGSPSGGSGNDAGAENGGGPVGGNGGSAGIGGAAIGGNAGGGAGGAVMGGFGGAPVAGGGVGGSPAGGAGVGGSGNGGGGIGGTSNGGMSGRGFGGFGEWGGMAGSLSGGSGAGGLSGTGGSGGAGGSAGECLIGINELFPPVIPTGQFTGLSGTQNPSGASPRSFDGYLLQEPCNTTACDDCGSAGWVYDGIRTSCNSTGLNAVQNFTVGGVPGQRYRVTLHFYGIVEPKDYGILVTRAAGSTRPNNLDTGATPPPFAYAIGNPTYRGSDYNTYELHVVDNTGAEVCSYFLNSDTLEGHWTYVLNYERTIDVIGGGRIRMRSYDRNCRSIKNCYAGGEQGPCTATGCNDKARLVDVSQANPQPSGLMQPGLGNNSPGNCGQWLFIDVTNVSCGQQALTCSGM